MTEHNKVVLHLQKGETKHAFIYFICLSGASNKDILIIYLATLIINLYDIVLLQSELMSIQLLEKSITNQYTTIICLCHNIQ